MHRDRLGRNLVQQGEAPRRCLRRRQIRLAARHRPQGWARDRGCLFRCGRRLGPLGQFRRCRKRRGRGDWRWSRRGLRRRAWPCQPYLLRDGLNAVRLGTNGPAPSRRGTKRDPPGQADLRRGEPHIGRDGAGARGRLAVRRVLFRPGCGRDGGQRGAGRLDPNGRVAKIGKASQPTGTQEAVDRLVHAFCDLICFDPLKIRPAR